MIALLAQTVVVLCVVGIGVMVGRKFMGRPIAGPLAPAQPAQPVWSVLGPIMRRTLEQARAAAGRFGPAARRVASQTELFITKAIRLSAARLGAALRRSQAEFHRRRPAIERLGQVVQARSSAIVKDLQPKISQALSRALQLAGQAGHAGRQAGQKGLALARSRIEALSNTLKHIRMRQTEHAQRMRTKEKFLGELMAKVQKSEDKPAVAPPPVSQEAAPPAPPIAPTPVQTPHSAAKETLQPSFWSRFKLPHPASRSRSGAAAISQTAPPRALSRPEEPENQARMVKILREQEQIILRQIVKHPKDITLYKRLGFVYLELGESTDAVECFRQAVKLGSQDPLVRKELQRLLAH